MNPEWKDPWVAALRSGEYPQGHHMLKGGEGYCCLGVLAHIAADAIRADGDNWVVDETERYMTVEAGAPSQTVLPPPLQMYFGLTSDDMFILTGMNDGGMCDFPTIASYIETAL